MQMGHEATGVNREWRQAQVTGGRGITEDLGRGISTQGKHVLIPQVEFDTNVYS